MNRTLVALFIAAGISAPAAALQAEDTIVVTGSRIERYEDDLVPHIHLIRQADAISVRLRVVCDTRDRGQRVRELRDTLRNLIQTSNRDQSVDVGVLIEQSEFGNEVIVDFDESMVETIQASAGYGRTDVSQVTIMATTPIRDTDTVDLAADRISDFVNAIRVVGRTEVLNTGDWVLTVTGVRPDTGMRSFPRFLRMPAKPQQYSGTNSRFPFRDWKARSGGSRCRHWNCRCTLITT